MQQPRTRVFSRIMRLSLLGYLGAGLACGGIAYWLTDATMRDVNQRHLQAVLRSRARLVEDHFHTIREQVRDLTQSDLVVAAVEELTAGYHSFAEDLQLGAAERAEVEPRLRDLYRREMAEHLPATTTIEIDGLLPGDETGRLLQWVYLAENPNASDARNAMHESRHASRFEQAHRTYHPRLERFLRAFSFRDIFLVDRTGALVYTTKKEIDFATNLQWGPHARTGLGRACRAALTAEPGGVVAQDYERYLPSWLEPAAFYAAPIHQHGECIGVVAVQLAAEELNSRVFDLIGLGTSGEVYIVGADHLMRTDSRFSDTPTMLEQRVDSAAARQALAGNAGFATIDDYRDVRVLSQYRPLEVADMHWAMLAEVDEAEVMAPAKHLAWSMLGTFALALLLVAWRNASELASHVARPVRQLLAGAEAIAAGNYAARVDTGTDDEFGALATSHNEMAAAVEAHVKQLETALAEVRQLQGLLPICAACKSIRDDDGYFRTVETYLVGKSKLQFSHTVCNDCMPRLYPEFADELQHRRSHPSG